MVPNNRRRSGEAINANSTAVLPARSPLNLPIALTMTFLLSKFTALAPPSYWIRTTDCAVSVMLLPNRG